LKDHLYRSLGVVEKYLSSRTYLVGERITLADITVASALKGVYETHIDASLRPQYPHSLRFYHTIVNQEKIKPIWGETDFVEKATQYVPPAKEKKEKAPAPPAPVKEKPAAKPAAKEDDEEDEPLVPEEPKAKNPLDLLPKSTFNLEDWKRAYSNKDTRGPDGALEWFYQK
jgi:elongation factor 1-gamma